ncbi:MAG: nitroreductase [Epsilonproteobacteria bacterium]|nr:MAG: nitroreductase [Campylobacterota bacterium]
MNIKEFKNIVKNTRCTRRFKPNMKIDKSTLLELIDVAREVSSAKNLQPLKYIIITDEKIKEKIYKPLVFAAGLPNWTQKIDEKPSAYILVLDDKSIDGFSAVDSGIAMQTIMLGATTIGLSGCMMASINKVEYKKILSLPKHIEPMFIIALGIKNETIHTTTAKDGDTLYYRDTNDNHIVPKRSIDDVILEVI